MDINEFIERKKKLETDMRDTLADLVNEFHKETGCSPDSIFVCLEDVMTLGDPRPRYIVTDVICDVTL